jgi:tryptophan-rich hypothetical protein
VTNEPQNPSHIVGTKWTAVDVDQRRKHWQVVEFVKSDGDVVIEAVIDNHRRRLPWRQLRDRDVWLTGWR